jgi:hypothetical protein
VRRLCLGVVRFIEPKFHHKRVEILADTNARARCRQLAREHTKRGFGLCRHCARLSWPKADLNDVLRELGSTAVLMAVEDAEHFTTAADARISSFDLRIVSDVEIAHKIVERLEELYRPVIVCESRVWRFDQTHWAALDDDHLVRFVHRADGALYVNADGKPRVVRLNRSRVASILDAAIKYRHQPDYFKFPPRGINCESGAFSPNTSATPSCPSTTRLAMMRTPARRTTPMRPRKLSSWAKLRGARRLDGEHGFETQGDRSLFLEREYRQKHFPKDTARAAQSGIGR